MLKSTKNRAGIRDPHPNSGHWRDSSCIVVASGIGHAEQQD
jgi:hypothetical protein